MRIRGVALRAGILTCLIAALAPALALAEAPSNDDFANRTDLGQQLPVELTDSNVGATKESDESLGGLAPAGHSVWFEWEAPSDEWVTIGACESDFPALLGVYTGTAVGALTKVASVNSSEGPHCPFSQREYTFKANAGSTYEIAVDGNAFYVETPPPTTVGSFVLRIEATPPPANDDFASSTVLKGQIGEEPGGNRFYDVHTTGYNWKATTEVGEPFYGTSSGASVWYTWTPPETGKYRLGGPCCGNGLNVGLYVGDSVDQLTQILATTGFAEVMVFAGTTYRINVYGTPDLDTGEPTMGLFNISISANLPPLPSSTGSGTTGLSSPDTVAPDTKISKLVLNSRPPIFVFHFASTETGSSFRCKLDGQPLIPCGSGKRFGRNYKPGRHLLEVTAVDAAGNADPTPAVAHFTFPRRHPRGSSVSTSR